MAILISITLFFIAWLVHLWFEKHSDIVIDSMRAEFDSYKEAIHLFESVHKS